MNKYITLAVWIAGYLMIGSLLGSVTQAGVDSWYIHLNKSPYNPPDVVFPVVWSLLYIMLAYAGYHIFCSSSLYKNQVKVFYIIQMILNWSWTPIFFYFHLTQLAFFSLILMCLITIILVIKTLSTSRIVGYIFMIYLIWIMFATYLSGYIWLYN